MMQIAYMSLKRGIFIGLLLNKKERIGIILAKGLALVRGIFIGLLLNKKETIK